MKNDIWDIVPLPKGHKAIDCKWVIKNKEISTVTKSATCSKGICADVWDRQQKGVCASRVIYFNPLCSCNHGQIQIACASYGRKDCALNGNLHKNIDMKQPDSYFNTIRPTDFLYS